MGRRPIYSRITFKNINVWTLAEIDKIIINIRSIENHL